MPTIADKKIKSFSNAQTTPAPIAPTQSVAYSAIVAGKASKVFTKSNGNEFVYIQVELQDGAAAGHTVLGMRTTLSAGVDKEIPAEGEEVTVYHTKLPSTKEAGKFVHFFEISMNGGGEITSNDELSALL